MGTYILLEASFVRLSPNSLPVVPTCAFVRLNRDVHTLLPISCNFSLIYSVRNVCLFMLFSDSRVVILSVCTVVTLPTSLSNLVCTHSKALSIANASAWLMVHMVFILYIISTVVVPGLVIMYACMYVCVCVCMYMCLYVRMYVLCVYVHVCICMCVCMYVSIYVSKYV
jgi:hypothetical protein